MKCFACGEELRWDNTCRKFGCAQWAIPVAVAESKRWMIMATEGDEVLIRWEAAPNPELWYKVPLHSNRPWDALASAAHGWQNDPVADELIGPGTPVSPMFRGVVDAIKNLREKHD